MKIGVDGIAERDNQFVRLAAIAHVKEALDADILRWYTLSQYFAMPAFGEEIQLGSQVGNRGAVGKHDGAGVIFDRIRGQHAEGRQGGCQRWDQHIWGAKSTRQIGCVKSACATEGK